jgi:hypothetical protein
MKTKLIGEVKLKNTGTKESPFYQVLIGKVELCATNSKANAEMIIEMLSDLPSPQETTDPICNKSDCKDYIQKKDSDLIEYGVCDKPETIKDESPVLLSEITDEMIERQAIDLFYSLPGDCSKYRAREVAIELAKWLRSQLKSQKATTK